MKIFIGGIILIIIGVLVIVNVRGSDSAIFIGLALIIAGAFLTYIGNRYKNKAKQTSELALQMLRENEKIDAIKLAQRLNISEVDIRGYIVESQRKGIIPFNVEIIWFTGENNEWYEVKI